MQLNLQEHINICCGSFNGFVAIADVIMLICHYWTIEYYVGSA